jgi:hypothetical protein
MPCIRHSNGSHQGQKPSFQLATRSITASPKSSTYQNKDKDTFFIYTVFYGGCTNSTPTLLRCTKTNNMIYLNKTLINNLISIQQDGMDVIIKWESDGEIKVTSFLFSDSLTLTGFISHLLRANESMKSCG